MLPEIAVCRELATALRAGDDSAAAGLAARAGIPRWLLTHLELGPRGRLDVGDAGEALACISGLAAGRAVTLVPWLAKPTVIDLVAEAVETAVVPGTTAEHPWAQGIAALEGSGHPALPMLLRARAEEGSGRSDRARQLIESCLRVEEDLLPAVRDALEYELCAGNWARASELALAIGSDDIAEPLLRPLDRLRQPARGSERASRNQPCPCGSGRKYKACCRVRDLECGVHPLPHRAPALYAMLATYARRGSNRMVADRMAACAIGAPHAAMLALDLAIFDGGAARRFLAARGHLLREDERALLGEWLAEPVDMYEVSSVRPGSELSLRSLVGGPQRVPQRDRMFSLSVRRLDIVVGPLLPDGARPEGGGRHLQALGGMGILPRDLREAAEGLFPGGPVAPEACRCSANGCCRSSPASRRRSSRPATATSTGGAKRGSRLVPLGRSGLSRSGPAWSRPARRSGTRTATTPISSRCPGASGHATRRTRSSTPARSSRVGSPTSGPSGAA